MGRRLRPLVLAEAAALVAWLALAVAFSFRGRPDHIVPIDPAALAAGPGRERWYGIFFQDQHVGWSVTRTTPVRGGGTLYENRSSFRAATMGRIQRVVTAGAAVAGPDGGLRRFDFFLAADDTRLAVTGEVRGDEVVLDVAQAGRTSRLAFPVERAPQVGLTLEEALRGRELAEGLRFTVPYFDPVTLAEGEMEVEVVGTEVLEGGEEAWWLRQRFAGMETRALVASNGEVLRQEAALGLSLVRMTEEAARDVPEDDEPVDLIALSAVHVKGAIPRPRATRLLRLRIRGIDPERVAEDPPLQVREGDVVTVRVPDVDALPPEPVRAEDAEEAWLASTPTMPAAHPDIRRRAAEVAGDAADRLTAVRRLVRFVAEHVEDVPVMGVPDALEALRSARGDCNEHTALFVALARAAGIPTRVVAGLVWSDRAGPKPAFFYHAWAEVRLGGTWVPVDPTFAQVPADATHVALVHGDLDRQVEIMAFVGRIGVEVLEAR